MIPLDFFLRLWWHRLTGLLAAILYRYPARNLKVIGVTGTDGKTSTVEFLVSILESFGMKVGLASTIRFQVGDNKWNNTTHKTTLGRFELQKLLRRMLDAKCDVVVLEVSSHALEQGRLIGVPFSTAVITNLSSEHLDFHRSMKRYSLAKQKLFRNVQDNFLRKENRKERGKYSIVVNIDDEYFDNFIKYEVDQKIAYSFKTNYKSSDILIYPSNINLTLNKSSFSLNFLNKKVDVDLKVLGSFSIYNAMAAVGASINFMNKIDEDCLLKIKKGLENVKKVPGRMELISRKNSLKKEEPYCLIDFALTPKAVESLYKTLKNINPNRKLISVFGSCGDRDKSKRPKLGKLAKNYADLTVVCDDETYGENMLDIRTDILKGAVNDLFSFNDRLEKLKQSGLYKYNDNLYEIPDRAKAIHFAINQAKKGDIVVMTGIGDFDSRIIYGKKIFWDERGVVLEALEERYQRLGESGKG